MIRVCVSTQFDPVLVEIPEADDWNTSASGTLTITQDGDVVAEFKDWCYVVKPIGATA